MRGERKGVHRDRQAHGMLADLGIPVPRAGLTCRRTMTSRIRSPIFARAAFPGADSRDDGDSQQPDTQ